MPNYAFRATDRLGNAVEGTVSAPNEALAANQIGQMGYALISLQAAAESAPTVPGPTQNMPPPSAAPTLSMAAPAPGPLRPRPIDLTQPVTELPANGPAVLTPSDGSNPDPNATAEMKPAGPLEPWQRGGPVPQPPPPQMTISTAGVVLGRTQTLPATSAGLAGATGHTPPSVYTTRPGVETPRAGEAIPYGRQGQNAPKPLAQRFMEVMVYPLFSGVVIKDLAAFYRQFATLIGAGLPLFQSLIALESNTQNAKLKEVARAGQLQVQAGGKFSDVLAAWPWIFKPVQVELIRAAEHGGMLEQVLKQVADYVEHEWEIKRLIGRETLYPKIVLFVAFMILGRSGFFGGRMALVSLVLGGMGQQKYELSQYLLDTVGFGAFCLFLALFPIAVFRLFLFNAPGVREGYDTFKMVVPGIGKLTRMFALARFGRTMAAMYRGGFGMSYALDIAGEAAGNAVLRHAVQRAIPAAERGELASDALRASGFFPPMALDMFRTGETAGRLDEMLDKMADFYEAEAKMKTHQAALIFGTCVFLLVAILVAIQVIGFWMGYGAGATSAGGE